MTHKEHQEHNNHDTTKNGVIFELEDLSHPTGWLVGWLQIPMNCLVPANSSWKEQKTTSVKIWRSESDMPIPSD